VVNEALHAFLKVIYSIIFKMVTRDFISPLDSLQGHESMSIKHLCKQDFQAYQQGAPLLTRFSYLSLVE
jgi:hypothetical protein